MKNVLLLTLNLKRSSNVNYKAFFAIMKKDAFFYEKILKQMDIDGSKIISKKRFEEIGMTSFLIHELLEYESNSFIEKENIDIQKSILGYKVVYVKSWNYTPVVSISHKLSVGIACSSSMVHPVGVDLEYAMVKKEKVYAKYTMEEEINCFYFNSEMEGYEKMAILWSAKEALSKVIGLGFSASKMVYSIKSIKDIDENVFEILFKHIWSLKVVIYYKNNWVLALSFAKNTKLSLDNNKIFDFLSHSIV